MDPIVYSVSTYLDLVNDTLRSIDSDAILIEGEVSDFRIAQGKWVSFDLKDEEEQAVLKCFMTTWQLKVPLEDGMRVRASGYPKIYERFGTFKLNVQSVEPVGEGALRRAYELLKQKLQEEGLFDPARKRALVRFPERIGLITSRDAAAYGDFLRILNNRWGGVPVLFHHVHVQGREAVKDILGAFETFNALPAAKKPDVIVMTRGGGGLEDLHAFNDELVARAVYASTIPVVCAVGHERDESLADYVADVRASTPSNAAERVVPSRSDIDYELSQMTARIEEQLTDRVREQDRLIERVAQMMEFISQQKLQELQRYLDEILRAFPAKLAGWSEHIASIERLLGQVDPKRILARGYSLVRQNGVVMTDAATLRQDDLVDVQLATGSFEARVLGADHGQQSLL